MKASPVDVPEHVLQERHRRGDDRFDEMWEGVLHLVPAPLNRHQQLQGDLYVVLIPPARARGLVGSTDTALYRPGREDTDYRIPDLVVSTPERRARRGVAGRAELVVEIQSSGDESLKKVPFYAEMDCQDVLIIDRDTLALVLFLQGERQPEADGYDLASLDVRVERIDGPQLAVTWQGETTVITPFPG